MEICLHSLYVYFIRMLVFTDFYGVNMKVIQCFNILYAPAGASNREGFDAKSKFYYIGTLNYSNWKHFSWTLIT